MFKRVLVRDMPTFERVSLTPVADLPAPLPPLPAPLVPAPTPDVGPTPDAGFPLAKPSSLTRLGKVADIVLGVSLVALLLFVIIWLSVGWGPRTKP